jgi:hypothetical protein
MINLAMNWKQITFLWLGIVLLILTSIYPQYLYAKSKKSKGHYFVWAPPIEENHDLFDGIKSQDELGLRLLSKKKRYVDFSINYDLLIIQNAIIALLTIGAILSSNSKKEN